MNEEKKLNRDGVALLGLAVPGLSVVAFEAARWSGVVDAAAGGALNQLENLPGLFGGRPPRPSPVSGMPGETCSA